MGRAIIIKWEFVLGILSNGKILHSNIENYLRGTPIDELVIGEPISRLWSSIKTFLPKVQTGVRALESAVVHPELHYCGIVDCIGVFRCEKM